MIKETWKLSKYMYSYPEWIEVARNTTSVWKRINGSSMEGDIHLSCGKSDQALKTAWKSIFREVQLINTSAVLHTLQNSGCIVSVFSTDYNFTRCPCYGEWTKGSFLGLPSLQFGGWRCHKGSQKRPYMLLVANKSSSFLNFASAIYRLNNNLPIYIDHREEGKQYCHLICCILRFSTILIFISSCDWCHAYYWT